MIGIREYSDRGRGDRDSFSDLEKSIPVRVASVHHWDPNGNYDVDENANTVPLAPSTPTPTTLPFANARARNQSDDVVRCPICDDPVIEATVSMCGHTFCHDCILDWKKIRNWCPICQESLTTNFTGASKLHRVYAIDNITENHLGEFSLDVQQRFLRRRTIRLAAAKKEMNSKHPAKYMRGLAREFRMYFQAKGRIGGLCHGLATVWRALAARMSSLPFGVSIVLLLVFAYVLGLCSCRLKPFHFLSYLWQAVQNYPGAQQSSPPTAGSTTSTSTSSPDPCSSEYRGMHAVVLEFFKSFVD